MSYIVHTLTLKQPLFDLLINLCQCREKRRRYKIAYINAKLAVFL